MKLTKDQIEQNRRDRINRSDKRNIIKRNVWGMEKTLESVPYTIPTELDPGITKKDLQKATVQNAVKIIGNLKGQIDSLGRQMADIPPEVVAEICQELGVSGGVEEILKSEEVSDRLKWQIIYNLDEAT